MKKLVLLCMICLAALSMQAQKCAVLDFQVGTNITEEEVDGLSYSFRSNFNLKNYMVVERMMINRIIGGFGYTRTDMTRQQMLRVGRELEATIIVVGTMNKFMEEYSVDIQAINVSSGITIATEGATFQRSEYKTALNTIAQALVKKLDNGALSTNPPAKPTAEGYTDLGLPSGTKWKNFNATGFYTYDEAVSQFGSRLPSKEQWEELKAECQWTWTGSGFKVMGPNGQSISLPAAGDRSCSGFGYPGFVGNVGTYGYYWSSTPSDSDEAWSLGIGSDGGDLSLSEWCYGFSVRLVQD